MLFATQGYWLIAKSIVLLGLTFLISLTAARADKISPPQFRATIDIPDYLFEHEETRVMSWRIDGARAKRDRFAYLMLHPGPDGLERRALILIDSNDPEKAFFLEGSKLSPVLAETGKSLKERIDEPLTDNERLVDPNGAITVNILQQSGSKEAVRISFSPALSGFYDKFDLPCLALPDVLTLSRREKTYDFVVLLDRDKVDNTFGPTCGDFGALLKPPKFTYLQAARLDFAFARRRFVFHYRNHIVSIPYDLDEVTIGRSPLLVAKGQLDNILKGLGIISDPDAKTETPEAQAIRETEAVQHNIDLAILALRKAKEDNR